MLNLLTRLIRSSLLVAAATPLLASNAQDARFEVLAARFSEQYLRTHPESATQLGDHRFDAQVSDLSANGFARDRQFFRDTLKALGAIPKHQLSADNAVDAAILENALRAGLFDIDALKVAQREPLIYNPAQGLNLLLARDFAPLKLRLLSLKGRLKALPDQLKAARQNLQNPPRVFTETAIQQNLGAIGLLRDDLEVALRAEPAMRAQIEPLRHQAMTSLQAYGDWLKQELLPRSTGEFRLGAAHHREKLRYSLDADVPPEAVLQQAERELVEVQAQMLDTAKPLYRDYFPERTLDGQAPKAIIRAVLDKLAESRPDNDSIVAAAKRDLAEATEFVRAHQIVSVPNDPVQVIVMPEFARGVAIAYCDAAGPLEKNGATFYAISPTPKDWSASRATSFYREYNDAMLKNLTVHEAMPGHYLQLNVGNKARSRTQIRQIFSSGLFAEGWATYTEQLMADAGYGGPQVRMQQLKMRLRMLINAIIDQKIHAGDMGEKEAMALMMEEGFQEEGEAAGKWRRAQLTSGQLSTYYVGNLEVNRLARDLTASSAGDLKTVNDRILGFGTIAPRYIRQLLKL
ncbi:DUF885 domain-containing protein [Chitinimonas sp.]|uniref:DUF885 domain-containing protein n=1 Tax=Chitinimonas sp. TaxID=1934313 RepID=UPI0035B18450